MFTFMIQILPKKINEEEAGLYHLSSAYMYSVLPSILLGLRVKHCVVPCTYTHEESRDIIGLYSGCWNVKKLKQGSLQIDAV